MTKERCESTNKCSVMNQMIKMQSFSNMNMELVDLTQLLDLLI